MTDRTNIGVKATAKQQTVFLDSEQLLQYMEPAVGEETFSFTELCTGKLDVYLCLPATHTNSYKRWMRMMVNQSMRAVLRTGVRDLGLPVMYFLDEAGTTLGHLDAIENAYGLTSGMGLSCWSFYQDISQLKRDYPHSWQTFIANSATIQLMRVGDLETAKYFSEHFGQMTLTTVSTSTSARGGVAGQPGDNTQSTSYGEAGRAVLTHDEVMRISDKEMIVLDARMPPVQLYQVRYFSDARFNGLYRPDPKRQQTFPSAIEEPPHVAPGKQGWWINFKLANGGGNGYATYTRPFSLLRLLKFGALATAAVILAFAMFSYFSMDRVESPHAVQQTKTTKIQPAQQAKMDTFTAKLTALAKPPADVIKAVEERATSQSRLSHQAGWNYTSNLYDLGVQAPGESTMTVVGIEDCDDGKTGIEAARWRNVAFLLTKSPDGSWQVKEMAASTGYATKQALIFADATYPKSDVTPTPLPDKLP